MKNKLLFLSMHLPSNNVPQAGQKISFYNLNELSKKYEVHMVSFCNKFESGFYNESDYHFCEEFNIIPLSNLDRIINIISNIKLPYHYSMRIDRRVNKIVKKFIANYPDGRIHIEYENGCFLIPENKCSDARIVLHDVISQSLQRFLLQEKNIFIRAFQRVMFKWISKIEKKRLCLYDEVIVLNEKDRLLLNEFGINDNVVLQYPIVDESFYTVKRDMYSSDTIMFWGAMNRFENIDAVLWFYNDIWPHILAEVPSVKLYIVGANPSKEIKELSSENIIITGFVNDPLPYFEKSFISIVPLRYGAGIKIKVLEALATKMPVVSTTIGAEGVIDENCQLYVSDDKIQFAKIITNLIKSEKK